MRKIILLDLKKITSNGVLKAAFILMIVLFIFIQLGVSKYKEAEKSQQEFIKVESRLIERYFNYRVYGFYGFRMLVTPSPLFILTPKSSPFCALQADIDNAARMDIQKPEAPELIFKNSGGFLDFFTVYFFAGSILCLFLGYFALRDKEYTDFLKFSSNERTAYFSLFVSRSIFIVGYFLVLLFAMLLVLLLNGIKIEYCLIKGAVWLFVTAILTMMFSLAIGMFAASVRKKGLILASLIWILFALALPELVSEVMDSDAKKLNRYIFELKKITVLMNFEKEVYQKKVESEAKTPDAKFEIDKSMTERYEKKDSKEIAELERKNLDATNKLISKLHRLSSLSPFTLFKSTANEAGSMGYNTYIAFYLNNREAQKGFFEFYKKNVYDDPYKKVVPYLEEGENIFNAAPTTPQYFILGVLGCLLYIALFLFPGYLAFKKSGDQTIQGLNINLKKKHHYASFYTKDEAVESYCVQLAAQGNIRIDGNEIPKHEIFYLPDPDALSLLPKSWKKFFGDKANNKMWEIFFQESLKSGKKLILGHHFLEKRAGSEIKQIRTDLIEAGILYLEIGSDRYQWDHCENPICWKGD